MTPVALWLCSLPCNAPFLTIHQDSDQWDSLYNALGSRCYIIAGSASKSIPQLLEEGSIRTPRSSGRILTHTNQTTVSDLVAISSLLASEYNKQRSQIQHELGYTRSLKQAVRWLRKSMG